MAIKSASLQVLLPVHNEVESIEGVMKEIYSVINPIARMSFIITEDGSTDGTQALLKKLEKKYPMTLVSGKKRKGYSRGVIDGLKKVTSTYVLCLDSDGQCDPKDFKKFWEKKERADLIIGYRVHRQDSFVRKFLSRSFYNFYRILFPVRIKDPSCPYVLVKREVVKKLIPELGSTDQGFWWEFVARIFRRNYSIYELPVHHRLRISGVTQVYHPSKMLGIGIRHVMALFEIYLQTSKS
jgi:glycosyltransferase involved in cell wall biosynthesis